MVAVTAAAILAFGGVLHRDPSAASASDVLPTAVAAELQKGFAAGDTEPELGRYPAAFRAFDRMASLKPSVASYARVSYARELLGRAGAAEQAMALAASAAVGEREASSWTRTQLGLLYLGHSRPRH